MPKLKGAWGAAVMLTLFLTIFPKKVDCMKWISALLRLLKWKTRKMPNIVVYLDILGFSNYTEQDLQSAMLLLHHQKIILGEKLRDGESHPASSYADMSCARLAESNLVDSFLYFLPFSDSIFVVSNEPDKFARQLSNFLVACLQFVDHAYANADNPATPELVEIKDWRTGQAHQEHWYPPLWRGGMATGEVAPFQALALENRKALNIPNLVGNAVVKAVRLEKNAGLRGPRLFCESGFEKLFGKDIQPYFATVNESISELLWPAFVYPIGGNPSVDKFVFCDLWQPAVGLWKSKRGHASFEHYDQFLRLLIRSFLCWAEIAGISSEAHQFVTERVRLDLGEELIKDYLH
jgi:hypothetical protein